MEAQATHDSPPRPLIVGAVMSAASRVVVTVAGATATIVLAHVLGPEGWAAFFVAQSVALLLLAGATLGVEHGIVYYVSSARWGARAAFASALRVSLVTGIVGALVGLGARLLFPSAFAGLSVWQMAVVVAALPFALVWFYASYVALASDRYEMAMALPAVQAVLALALVVPLAVAFGLGGAVVGLTLAAVAVGLCAAVWGSLRLPSGGSSAPHQFRRAVSFGIKGYAANVLQLVNYRLDLFVLSAVASAAVVGSYSLAVALTSLLWLLPRALSDVLFPRVARLSRVDDDMRELIEAKSVRHASLVTIAGAALLAAGLVLLVVPVFGEDFRPAVKLGLILLPGTAAIALAMVLGATVVGRGKPAYSLYAALVTTPLTVALYAILIPWLDATGAALASTASYLGTFLLWCVLYHRVTGRRVAPLLIPTRSELEDLHGLWLRRPGGARVSERS